MRISDTFAKEVVSVERTPTVGDAARQMEERGVGWIIIVEQQRPVGVVTDRDVGPSLGYRPCVARGPDPGGHDLPARHPSGA